jgi:Spy/CpxP family protein refolding chaperone
MSRFIFSSVLCFFIFLQLGAQAPGMPERRMAIRGKVFGEQLQVERIAYFTEKIGLTTEEAQLFWPVYNEMDNKRTALFEERASMMHKYMNHADDLSDRQVEEQLNRLAAIQQQEMAIPAEYDAKFRKVLSARKVMNLYVAEMGFRNYLLQKMRNRHDGDRPGKQ